MSIPNILTFLRFCLVGVFIYVFNNPNIEGNLQWGIVIFIIAGITDVLDGYIARKFDMVTKWGKLMDPLADKLMLIVVLISLYTVELVPLIVIIIVLAKELLMVLGAIFIYRNRNTVVQSNIVGKSSSAAFYVAIIALVLNIPYAYYILGAAVILTIIALIQYGILNLKKPDRKVKSNLDNIS
ncbi:MAG: CDP-diacylglycerol--glycerol-3-phosphate 3-phosphatidyltransferase [Caldicoprobacterales bacterium]|mgnify:CR=1 FL=1|jgi:cardiolipin synthase|nr:CDP-diacylglycerol--glycerol-3-phosphate 3-phosphatidyltransferase [Clostridiales bacterium]